MAGTRAQHHVQAASDALRALDVLLAAGKMGEVETGCGLPRSNRMFFLSIPPNVFIPAAGGAADFCSTR